MMNDTAHADLLVLDRTQREDGSWAETRLVLTARGGCWLDVAQRAENAGASAVAAPERDAEWARRRPLPEGALSAVLSRYAKEVDPALVRWPPPADVASLTFDDGARQALLCVVPFLGFGSVYPTDWVIMGARDDVPLAAPAKLVVAALTSLADALERRRPGELR